MECEYCMVFKDLEKTNWQSVEKDGLFYEQFIWKFLQESPTENWTCAKLFSIMKHAAHNVTEILVESKLLKVGFVYIIITETKHVQLVREARISHLLLNMLCNIENDTLQEVKIVHIKKSLKLRT